MSVPADLHFLCIEPLDVLLRGNQSFGALGSYGDAAMPPWPSVVAGTIRSCMLADASTNLAAFARGKQPHPALGTPAQPRPFTLRALHVAKLPDQSKAPQKRTDLLIPPLADLVINEDNEEDKQKGRQVSQVLALTPTALPSTLAGSCPLPQASVLAQGTRSKPASGWWFTQACWQKYLCGQMSDPADCERISSLRQFGDRVGVDLSAETHSVSERRLFTIRAIAMPKAVGLVAAVSGVSVTPDAQPPESGLLRLGGDGHSLTGALSASKIAAAWWYSPASVCSRKAGCPIASRSKAAISGVLTCTACKAVWQLPPWPAMKPSPSGTWPGGSPYPPGAWLPRAASIGWMRSRPAPTPYASWLNVAC